MSAEKSEIPPAYPTMAGQPAEAFPPAVQQPGYGVVQNPHPIQQPGYVQQPIQQVGYVQQPGQPGYGPPPVQQVFVAPPQRFGTNPCVAICPHCHQQVRLMSRVNY